MKGILMFIKGIVTVVTLIMAFACYLIFKEEDCWIMAGQVHGWHYQYPEEEEK